MHGLQLHPPEILAPAGDEECLRAAVGAGADAVYFGLSAGFNARAKAENFAPADLARTFAYLHRNRVKGYVAFNTVVYDSELDAAVDCLAAIADAGADAVIVQDLGIARLCQALAPGLPVHASTQMTVSSPEGAAIAKDLGVRRVILPRELSIAEIARFRAGTDLELECFVHGALCVSYSGQCLTSEAWGQRSANRGQCAQSCRLPYDLIVDGKRRDLSLEKYLLSPKDLAAHQLLPDLIRAGVSCFKIEGRYKGADYVAGTVEKYRKVVDAYLAGRPTALSTADENELAFTYSRGFSPGWLVGDDHQELSHGVHPGHRGKLVGTVVSCIGFHVHVRLTVGAPPVKAGDWMVFEQGRPEEDEPKGGVFSVGTLKDGVLDIRFGEPGPDLTRVRAGDTLWKSHDSALKRRLLRYADMERKIPLQVSVRGQAGQPLHASARDAFGRTATAASDQNLTPALRSPLDATILRDKLAAFGDTPYVLAELQVALAGEVALSPGSLKRLRRSLVQALDAQPLPTLSHRRHQVDLEVLTPAPRSTPTSAVPLLVPLCRTLDQVDATLAFGAREIYLDFMELVGLREAVGRVKRAGARVVIATMRIQKPGEEPIDQRFAALAPDGILARHLGALHHFRSHAGEGFTLHGDFSLNATNLLTGRTLFAMGLETLTPSYDLNFAQLRALAQGLPAERLEITVHQHLPLYHTAYCLYAHHLSKGTDFRTCGRPCETQRIALGDGKGREHPVLVDVNCRNTVFNAQAQSAASHVRELCALGVRRFRAELVWESGAETTRVLTLYRDLLAGTREAAEVAAELGASERYGVTAGTFAVMRRTSLRVVA